MGLGKLPFANLRYRAGRTAGLVVLVALLAFIAFGGTVVVQSLQNGLASLEARLGADVIVAPSTAKSKVDLNEVLVEGVPAGFYMDSSYLGKVAEREGVELASPQYFLATVKAGCCSMPVQIIGFDPATDFTVKPWIARTFGGELGRGQVVVGCNIDGAVGATITLYGVKCDIVSKLAATGTKLDNAVFATGETVADLIDAAVERGFPPSAHEDPASMISTVQVKVADGYDPELVAADINVHVRGVSAVATKAMTSGVSDSVAGLAGVIGVLMAVTWLLAAALLAVVFTVVGRGRAREFAVLRVAGASRSALARVVLAEALVVSVAGAVCGIALAAVCAYAGGGALEDALGLPFLVPDAGSVALVALVVLVLTVAIGAAASALSAVHLSKIDPGQTLREE